MLFSSLRMQEHRKLVVAAVVEVGAAAAVLHSTNCSRKENPGAGAAAPAAEVAAGLLEEGEEQRCNHLAAAQSPGCTGCNLLVGPHRTCRAGLGSRCGGDVEDRDGGDPVEGPCWEVEEDACRRRREWVEGWTSQYTSLLFNHG